MPASPPLWSPCRGVGGNYIGVHADAAFSPPRPDDRRDGEHSAGKICPMGPSLSAPNCEAKNLEKSGYRMVQNPLKNDGKERKILKVTASFESRFFVPSSFPVGPFKLIVRTRPLGFGTIGWGFDSLRA